jgi:hypothetical protein
MMIKPPKTTITPNPSNQSTFNFGEGTDWANKFLGKQDYLDPNKPGELWLKKGEQGDAQLAGLQLGKLLTGQDIGTTGGQIQDLLQKQLALTNNGASNPITAAMQANKAQALGAVSQDLARAGVKGGAAQAAKLQTTRKLDRDIAAQAYQQHQDSLQQARQMMGGIASAQMAPMYQAEQSMLAANTPEFKPEKQTLWSFLGL